MKTVADVMTREVISIDADRTVSEAVALMKRRNISSLLVDRDSSVDAFGIITENDVISKVVALGRDPKAAKVREIMSKPIVTIPPECSLKDCAHLMSQRDVRRLTVFDGRRVTGIVSSSDIFDVTE